MKNKKIIIIFAILLIVLVVGGYFIIQNIKQKENTSIEEGEEYTPQEEISEEQSRQTMVSLYFQDKTTKEVSPEARMVDIKEFINTPYEKLINLLLEGPKSDKLQRIIPENTKLLKAELQGDCVTIDFSAEFLNYDKTDENAKTNLTNSIVETLTQLTEVNSVKILVDGKENAEFNDIYERQVS